MGGSAKLTKSRGSRPALMLGSRASALAAILALGAPLSPALAQDAAPTSSSASNLALAISTAEGFDPSGQPAETVDAWRNVIALAQAQDNPAAAAIVRAHNSIGDAYYYGGRPDLAEAELRQAVELLEAQGMGDTDVMSETLANLGVMIGGQGHPAEDRVIQSRALAIREALYGADDPRLAQNYFNLGNALYELGQSAEAADNIERGTAMRLATLEPDDPDLFITLATAAAIVEASGRTEKAIEFAQLANDLVNRHHPGHIYTGFVRGVLGKALVGGGRAAEGAKISRQAVDELAASMGQSHRLTLDAISALAKANAQLGNFADAKELLLASLEVESEADSGRTGPEIVRGLISASNYASEAGEQAEAVAIAQRGYDYAREQLEADHAVLGQIAMSLGVHLSRQSDHGGALALLREASAIYAVHEAPESTRRLELAVHLGGAEILADERGAVGEVTGFARITRAAAQLEPIMLAGAESPDLGSADSGMYDVFARAAEAASDLGFADEAFRFFQLASFNTVAQAGQQVALRKAAGLGGDAADLVRKMQDEQRNLRALGVQKTALLAAGKTQAVERVEGELEASHDALGRLRRDIGAAVPGFDRLSRPQTLELGQLQARLTSGEGVFLALPSRTRTLLMLVTGDDVAMATSANPRSAMRAQVGQLRASIDEALLAPSAAMPAFDSGAAFALYQTLFPPSFQPLVDGLTQLHVAASDALAQLPFSLLVTGKNSAGDGQHKTPWLIRKMSVNVPVSLASIGQVDAANARTQSAPSFAGIGAPSLNGSPNGDVQLAGLFRNGQVNLTALRQLPELPSAAVELERMRGAFSQSASLVLTGDEAREEQVKAMDLRGYSVLAFATHALIANELEGLDEPALVLTPPEEGSAGDDGLLTSSEIADLDILADFVILSACNTAAGATQAAPAYTGLAHAFLYAGAKSLLLSHWQVRDDAAASLSVATVQGHAAGLDKSEALRQAILQLMDDPAIIGGDHPAIWAPFILVEQ